MRAEAKSLYNVVIQPSDLHVDFGLRYLGLYTDTQMAYVLPPGTDAAPPWLAAAMARGNRLQDPNERLYCWAERQRGAASGSGAARAEGLGGAIYTHPLGASRPCGGADHRHVGSAGRGTGVRDYPHPNTAYAIESFMPATPRRLGWAAGAYRVGRRCLL